MESVCPVLLIYWPALLVDLYPQSCNSKATFFLWDRGGGMCSNKQGVHKARVHQL